MRVMTTTQARVATLQARGAFVDVRVYNATAGGYVSLRNIFGFQFVRDLQWTESVDDNGRTATITLDRNIYNYSLSPLLQYRRVWDTYGQLVGINTFIKVFAAIKPMGQQPSGTTDPDWIEVFWGRTYQIDFSTNKMSLQCRDMLDQLQSVWMECSAGIIPSSTTAYSASSVMQQLLNYANGMTVNGVPGLTGTNLQLTTVYSVNGTSATPFKLGVTPDDPAWSLASPNGPYPNSLMSMWTALDNINQQIGWCLRQKWNANIGTWALTWYDPGRTSTTSLYTFTPAQYINISQCELHLGDIRNAVGLWYKLPSGAAVAMPVATDSTSISKYGRQFMQIGSDSTPQITGGFLGTGVYTGLADAYVMQQQALSDLAQPSIDFVVDVPFFPFVELNDIYTFTADDRHFSANQNLAVVQYSHSIDAQGMGKTTLGLRGKPSGGVTRWLGRQVQNFTKALGATNTDNSSDQGNNLTANSAFTQFTRF